MIHNEKRIGNFTSSEIYNLLKKGKSEPFGKPALTYIEEKQMERRLGRALNDIGTAKPLIWGKLNEQRVFDMLGLEYSLHSQESMVHPKYNFWAGSPDGKTDGSIIELKCPFTLKSFCQFADCENIEQVRENHPDGEKYYWQCISNAILLNKDVAELIIYMPYKSELNDIRESCEDWDGGPNEVAWIHFSDDDSLPYLIDGGYYKNIYSFVFKVPESDKELLTNRVIEASKLLCEFI